MDEQKKEGYLRSIRKMVANNEATKAVSCLIDFFQADLREQLVVARVSREEIKADTLNAVYFLLKRRRDELGLIKRYCAKCGTFVAQIIGEEPTDKFYRSEDEIRPIVQQTLACECKDQQRTRPMPGESIKNG